MTWVLDQGRKSSVTRYISLVEVRVLYGSRVTSIFFGEGCSCLINIVGPNN